MVSNVSRERINLEQLGTPVVPRILTRRLILRGWTSQDFDPYAELLADPEAARFITRRGAPYNRVEAWLEYVFFIGHWQALGYGMFVVEDRQSGAFLGRVGPLHPPHWPGLEIAWAITPAAQGKGIATEAAEATIRWVFAHTDVGRIVSIINPENVASRKVAIRVGEHKADEQFAPFGATLCDVWSITREEFATIARQPSKGHNC